MLILVAGVAAILAALAIAFLGRMREDAAESRMITREAQARIMLVAACSYLREASRLGYDDPATPTVHEEAFGWVDVRDGTDGPKTREDASSNAFPVGSVARCPMHLWTRTRFAISTAACANPIADESSPDFGRPYLRNPDPRPAVDNGWPGSVDAARWDDFARGDPRPRPTSVGMAWFRVKRIASSRFVVACGGGGTEGWRDWNEVAAAGPDAIARFGHREVFDALRDDEPRLWYRVEWSPAVSDNMYQLLENRIHIDHYAWRAFNASQDFGDGRSQAMNRNPVGTIRWIQRLAGEPADW
ncbi:MAG TPA: hypothetical protein VEL07_05945 [Planctomycetota bacterium]|nr:hypothetical protein [Planctomycetota bacterium]